jgi:hypothetical protein
MIHWWVAVLAALVGYFGGRIDAQTKQRRLRGP